MLGNFIVCVNAVIPLFIFLVIGALVRRFGILNEEEVHRFNRMVFIVFFPPLMFENLYVADIKNAFDIKLVAFAAIYVLCVYFLSFPAVYKLEKNGRSRGAMIQGIYRSNFVLMGLPLAINIFGKGSASETAALIMIVVPLYNILAVITLEYFRGGHVGVGDIIKNIFKNPIIIGALAGIVALLLHIKLPGAVSSIISDMSSVTTPMALILLGASFDIGSVAKKSRDLVMVLFARLVIVPGIGLALAYAFGFRGQAFVALLAMLATPAAVSSYTMAESMDSDGELAGNIVIFSTPIACLTLFLWLFLFKSMGAF